MLRRKIIATPCEKMILVSDGEALIHANFIYDEEQLAPYMTAVEQDDHILLMATEQIEEYFALKRKEFTIPLKVVGTAFQERVWEVLAAIPYGEVLTYKEIAHKANSPKAFQATGGACKANPIALIIPCHRVLGANGSYTGFAGDKIYMKEALLKLEAGQRSLDYKK